jgi:hypothetical protein
MTIEKTIVFKKAILEKLNAENYQIKEFNN